MTVPATAVYNNGIAQTQDGAVYVEINGGGAATSTIVDDTTTNATMYPVWVTAATGSLPLKVTSTKMTWNPSTGLLGATGFRGNSVIAGVSDMTLATGDGPSWAVKYSTGRFSPSTDNSQGIGESGLCLSEINVTTVQSGAARNLLLKYNTTTEITIGNASTTVASLAGTGSRAVLADANGLLSAPVSDETWKENMEPLSYGLGSILALRPLSFNYKDRSRFGNQKYLGFGARATAKILPEVTGQDNSGTFYLCDEKITPVLVRAVQQPTAAVGALAILTLILYLK